MRRQWRQAWIVSSLAAFFAAVLIHLVDDTADAQTRVHADVGASERRVLVMGTTLDVAVRLRERERALAAAEAAIAEVRRIEELLTTWREGGPLARVNASALGKEVRIDAELATVLSTVFGWSARTQHAFDPTVLPLVRAWDLRGMGRIASEAEIAAARAAMGSDRFQLDSARGTIIRLDPLAGIDEGAWGKGYALDRAATRLREAGVADALLDLGGQVLAIGADAGGAAWTVSIAHPRDRQRPVVRLALPPGASLSTSGNSERSRRVGSRLIGHLLDPRTGAPATDFGSVSVVSPSALTADVLSTAFFVLGPEAGLQVSAVLRREGVPNEVLFLVDRGPQFQARTSDGFDALVLAADPDTVVGLPKNSS
jgi:thiamine biosynthesis lipoprotein